MSEQPTVQVPLDVLEELVGATAEVSTQRAYLNGWPDSTRGKEWARQRECLTQAESILEQARKENQCS